jgi:soluble lytic murein transglycosylase-like protein
LKKISMFFLIIMLTVPAWAQPWPKKPPQIGDLYLKQEYWEYIKEAAERYNISPYLIQAVCAIESRYDKDARSGHGKCIGLMQLHIGTAKIYGVDPYNPRENIMGGAAVLAKFYHRYNGNIRKVLRKYNSTCTRAYEREVIKAYQQASSFQISTSEEDRLRH